MSGKPKPRMTIHRNWPDRQTEFEEYNKDAEPNPPRNRRSQSTEELRVDPLLNVDRRHKQAICVVCTML